MRPIDVILAGLARLRRVVAASGLLASAKRRVQEVAGTIRLRPAAASCLTVALMAAGLVWWKPGAPDVQHDLLEEPAFETVTIRSHEPERELAPVESGPPLKPAPVSAINLPRILPGRRTATAPASRSATGVTTAEASTTKTPELAQPAQWPHYSDVAQAHSGGGASGAVRVESVGIEASTNPVQGAQLLGTIEALDDPPLQPQPFSSGTAFTFPSRN